MVLADTVAMNLGLQTICEYWTCLPVHQNSNPIEHVCDELREKFFQNRVFDSLSTLEDQLKLALKILRERATQGALNCGLGLDC